MNKKYSLTDLNFNYFYWRTNELLTKTCALYFYKTRIICLLQVPNGKIIIIKFTLFIVNFQCLNGDFSMTVSYSVYILQLAQYSRLFSRFLDLICPCMINCTKGSSFPQIELNFHQILSLFREFNYSQ